MNIKTETYNICKEIKKIELRNQIKDLINELNISSKQNKGASNDRSEYGYIARKQNAQFMGYLIVDEKREEIEKDSPSKVPEIELEEKELLKKAHYIIKYLNEKLTHSIVERVPNLKLTLNPYSQFSYQEYSLDITQIINISTFDSLIEAVSNCNVIKNIDNTSNKLIQNISSKNYLGLVLAFIKRIERYGVHNTPEDFKDLNFKEDSPEYILNKLLFSLMSFRKILENIDQLIYQAFFMDKIVVLNDNNIINILKNNTHMIGQGLTILIQPIAREIFANLGDLILVKHNFSNINKLCVVEGENISINMELGNQIEFKLRTVDDNLNPYFGLINNI